MKFKSLDLYSDEELALCVWAGFFGDGVTRKLKLGNRYKAVQAIVEKQAKTDTIEPMKKYDKEALVKAIKSVYSEAAEELISEVEENI